MATVVTEKRLRLLLIDDEEGIHATVGAFLERMGHEVLGARNGAEGLELFARSGADIIISDYKMPDLDGLQLLRQLREMAADVDVILITGHGDMETAIQALRAGAFDFFGKPVRLEELMASVERTRRYQAMRREKDRVQARLESILLSRPSPSNDDVVGERFHAPCSAAGGQGG